mmetsp:Transcript_4548/g.13486  ORF Transcript_4548/g.13486 Transcript_4548/m.13486 type:complete len:518 (+) Transcript_4548:116-1669(+)
MVLPHTRSVGNGQEADSRIHENLIELLLAVGTHCTRALIEDGELWLVTQQTSHRNPLLLSPTKSFFPVHYGVERIALQQVVELYLAEGVLEVSVPQEGPVLGRAPRNGRVVPARARNQFLRWVRVKELVSEGASDQVRPLAQEEHLVVARSRNSSLRKRPQACNNPDKTGLPGSVRSRDQHGVLLVPQLHAQVLHQNLTVWRTDGHPIKDHSLRLPWLQNFHLSHPVGLKAHLRHALGPVEVHLPALGVLHLVDLLKELGHPAGVPGELGNPLVDKDQVTDTLAGVLKEPHAPDVVLRPRRGAIRRNPGDLLGPTQRAYGIDREGNHARAVLDEVLVGDLLQKLLDRSHGGVPQQGPQVLVQQQLLSHRSGWVVVRHLLGLAHQPVVRPSQVTRQAGFLGVHQGQRRTDGLEGQRNHEEVRVQHSLGLVAHHPRQGPGEEDHVQERLEGVVVELADGVGKVLHVFREPLIDVRQVHLRGRLVVAPVLEVLAVEVHPESLPEPDLDELLEHLQAAVHH